MLFFFYGTLMDEAVLSAVIGRAVSARQLQPAMIVGFKRVYAAGVTYPVLLPDADGEIWGRVFGPVRGEEAKALDHFEGANYNRAERIVHLANGDEVSTAVYLPVSSVGVTDKPWEFEDWKRRHRRAYLQRVTRWMRPG